MKKRKKYHNNVDERKLPATIHNNNEEEEEDDNDNNENDDNNKNDNDNDGNNSPRCSLLNFTHNDLDVPSKKENQTPIGNEIGGKVAKLQATEHLVSPNNLTMNCCKYDCHKYDVDLPLYKLDPFTTGAYVNKCVNEKLLPHCTFFQNN